MRTPASFPPIFQNSAFIKMLLSSEEVLMPEPWIGQTKLPRCKDLKMKHQWPSKENSQVQHPEKFERFSWKFSQTNCSRAFTRLYGFYSREWKSSWKTEEKKAILLGFCEKKSFTNTQKDHEIYLLFYICQL